MLAATTLLALGGCGASSTGEGALPAESHAILIDVSGSAEESGLLDRAIVEVENALFAYPDGTQLFVAVVDGATQSSTCRPVDADLTPEGKNETELELDRAALREEVALAVTSLVECGKQNRTSGSDLIGGFVLASRELADGGRRQVLLLSDGSQWSETLKTTNKLVSNPAKRQAAIEDLQGAGLVPDLAGVEIAFHGGGVGKPRPPEAAAGLKDFWSEYAEAVGGSLVEYKI